MPVIPSNAQSDDSLSPGSDDTVSSGKYSIKQVTVYSIAIILGSIAMVAIIVAIVRCIQRRKAAKVSR